MERTCGARFKVLLLPGRNCRVFGSLGCTIDFRKCSANRKNDTDEECGRKSSFIANVGTSPCLPHRNKYQRCTVFWYVSRIPHPTHQIHLILFYKVNLLSHLPPGGRNIHRPTNPVSSHTAQNDSPLHSIKFQIQLANWISLQLFTFHYSLFTAKIPSLRYFCFVASPPRICRSALF